MFSFMFLFTLYSLFFVYFRWTNLSTNRMNPGWNPSSVSSTTWTFPWVLFSEFSDFKSLNYFSIPGLCKKIKIIERWIPWTTAEHLLSVIITYLNELDVSKHVTCMEMNTWFYFVKVHSYRDSCRLSSTLFSCVWTCRETLLMIPWRQQQGWSQTDAWT